MNQAVRKRLLAGQCRPAGADGCWPWTQARTKRGYGRLRVGPTHKRTHRLMYELFIGPVPDTLMVLHTCDNPPCGNPAHLFIGTGADNMRDMVAKGRCKQQHGERNPMARVPAAVIEALRARAGTASHTALANEFGLSRTYVGRVLRGERRAHG